MKSSAFLSIKKLHASAVTPRYATEGSVGLDLFCYEDIELAPGQVSIIGVGWAIELPDGYEGQVRPRSGLSSKKLLLIPNSPGTIDTDYRGELKVPLFNASGEPVVLSALTAIAQLVVAPVVKVIVTETIELSSTIRGSGGLGSTGNF